MPDRATARRAVCPAGLLACGLAGMPVQGQTLAETAGEIEAMVDFAGSAVVDGDVVEVVDWAATAEDCTFGLTLRGTTDGGRVGTEFGATVDFRKVRSLRIKAAAAGPEAFRVALPGREGGFAVFARVEADAGDSPVLAEWKALLAAGEAEGTCDDTLCTLTTTADVATVVVMARPGRDDAAAIERPFKTLALLCEAAPQN